jgi:hypothetical protein
MNNGLKISITAPVYGVELYLENVEKKYESKGQHGGSVLQQSAVHRRDA